MKDKDPQQIIHCPRCRTRMNRIRRSKIFIDECSGCGGVFLDAGELAVLLDNERGQYAEQFGFSYPEPETFVRAYRSRRGWLLRMILGERRY